MAMTWMQALKAHFGGKKFVIPKKGTPDYEAVKKLMGGGAAAPAGAVAQTAQTARETQAKKPRKPRAKKVEAATAEMRAELEQPKTKRAPRAKKAAAASASAPKTESQVPSSTADSSVLSSGGAKAGAEIQVAVSAPAAAPVSSQKINREGLNPQERVFDQLTEKQSGLGIPQGNLPGLEKAIAAAILPTEGVKPEKKNIATDRTILMKRTTDPTAVDGKAPFSYNALKQRLFIN